MRFRWFTIAVLTLLMAAGCGKYGIGMASPFGAATPTNSQMSAEGQAVLQFQSVYDGVAVEIVELNASVITNASGNFALVNELADGKWTLRASYPYFSTNEQSFTVLNGVPETAVPTLYLTQLVLFRVATDTDVYQLGDTVSITLTAEAATIEPVTLSSPTTPLETFAVVHNGQTVVGSLLPGQVGEPKQITLSPGVPQTFNLFWTLDNANLEAGDYDIYAIVTDAGDYPEYFSADPALAANFNATLFDKLVPATITLAD